MGRKAGKGAKTRPRGEAENAYLPGDNKKRRALATRIKQNQDKTEVDPKLALALKHGIQRDKKRAAFDKFREAKKDAKRARREQRAAVRKETGASKLVPKTRENMRRSVLGMVDDAADPEIRRDEQMDEFSKFYAQTREKLPDFDEEKEEEDEEEEGEENEDEEKEELTLKEDQEAKDDFDDDDLVDGDDDEGLLLGDDALMMMGGMEDDGDDDDLDEDDDGLNEDAAFREMQDDKKYGKKLTKKQQREKEEDEKKQKQQQDAAANAGKKFKNPTILLTTCQNPSYRTRVFVRECLWLFPNSTYRPRKNYTLTEIIGYCTEANFDFVITIGERIKKPFELIVTHLPEGPTATFRVSNFLPAKEIENCAERTEHYPELNLKNFDTRLGRRISRILEAMFPATRDFAGRAIATFHNQRDFIFVRTHRYVFDSMDEVRIQELGPRMTLRLMSLQKGTFDQKFGEFEWIRKKKHDADKLEWFM